MVASVLLLVTGPLVSVPMGATDWDVAEAISQSTQAPVVIFVDAFRNWEGFRRKFETEEGFRRVIGNRYELKWDEAGAAYSSGAFSEEVAFPNKGGGRFFVRQPDFAKIPEGYDLSKPFHSSPNTYLTPLQVSQLVPGWTVRWHWFYEKYGLFAFSSPKSIEPAAFLQLVAKSMGAEANIDGKTVEFVPNLKEFRKREKGAIADYIERNDHPAIKLSYVFLDATIDAATDKQLQLVLEPESNDLQLPCRKGSRLYNLAQQRIAMGFDVETMGEVEVAKWRSWMQNLADPEGPAMAVLSRRFVPETLLRGRKPNSSFGF